MIGPADIRPSAAAVWSVCHGYAAMRAAYPEAPEEADNDIREDGLAAHWLAKEIWEHRYPELGSFAYNNRTLTEEMFDGVDLYHDVLRSWGVPVTCEKTLSCHSILPGMYGTPDAWAYNPGVNTIYIADLKFGFRFVEVWYNKQLIIYARAILDHLGLDVFQEDYTWIEFVIVQPRSYHRDGPVRKWKCRASDLRGYVNSLQYDAAMALRPEPACVPNPGCVDCPARHACQALQASAYTSLEMSYAGVPLELKPEALGLELKLLREAQKRIEARVSGLEAHAEALLRKGTTIPGWALYPSYARERWREGTESQVLRIGAYYNANLAKPAQPVSPAQARKLLPSQVVAMFAHKPSTGVKLSPVDPLEATKKFSS